ncbi:N5-carboxyaminoimidazole ribonucleotide mutase [candidate division MSBL1 archaeon SCGC-AAA382A20]|uniref:N5-carboxyaminoimidazole ribonucleotide mutase n=2 Tax=candidate division MSBL1 TaxID=215777 RepID=A0A133VK24_9EURY|nr:N5-carboxyaminoimidazole ribonucleotide mutase [candidate division MSBL1 archaeon SCGC-AAA382A03]KXB06808.1 N5-carboxyaminoimidazole ribonucleotide mutase [candidate division MSBL1 archaeon SCGC-AAA382A20]
MSDEKAIVMMGSDKDLDFTQPCLDLLEDFDIDYELIVASAHKTPEKVLDILNRNENEENLVYVTVAGRSNALSGMVDANTQYPVIACPPYSSKFGGADIFSSLRMPSGVSPMVILDPEAAALAVAKIFSLSNPELSEKVSSYQKKIQKKVEESDENIEEKSG